MAVALKSGVQGVLARSGSDPFVVMVQATDLGHLSDLACVYGLDRP